MREGGASSGRSLEGSADCRLAGELLKAGQYERVAQVLRALQVASEPTVDAILVQILDAARRLCLACGQVQAEAERYLQAYQEGTRREHELRQQLHTILGLIGQRMTPETLEKRQEPLVLPVVDTRLLGGGLAQPGERAGLWRRILTFLRREPPPPSSGRGISSLGVALSDLSSIASAESPAKLPTELPIEPPADRLTGVSFTLQREEPATGLVEPERAPTHGADVPVTVHAASEQQGPVAIAADQGTPAAAVDSGDEQAPLKPVDKSSLPLPLFPREGRTQTISGPEPWTEMATPETLADQETLAESRRKREQLGGPVPPSLAVYCLGPFRVFLDDQPVTDWSSSKGKSVFKYLVAHGGTPIAKDILMDVLWPDAVPDAARRNLHQAIYTLRQVLRQGHPDFPHIQFENDCYLLNPAVGLWLDFVEFAKHFQAGQRFEASRRVAEAMTEYGTAEALYQGDFLEEDLYEDWPRAQREHIRNMYFALANRLSGYYVQQGEHHAAIALCQKVLAQDNCYEEAHRRLMRCHLAQGQRHLAVRQYQACVEALKEELDLVPSEETVKLYRRITGVA